MKTIQSLLFVSLIILVPIAQAKIETAIAESACQQDYLDIFSDDVMNMTVVFGYDDLSEEKTNDLRSLDVFLNTLQTKCEKFDQKMCGFKLISKKPYVLTRMVIGPDGSERTLKITADASSYSEDNKSNRKNPLQKLQTEAIRKLFTHGLENSAMTVYMGHSRDGGGPSFEPPVLNPDGHVNYSYYHKNKKDRNVMVNALAKNPHKSRIVSLVSCSSIRWFSRSIVSSAPASGIIGTTEAFWTSNFQESLPMLERVYSFNCLKDFSVDDAKKFAKLQVGKEWKVSAKTQKLTKTQIIQKTLENLATNLTSPNISIRKDAYAEIKSFDAKLYSPRVIHAVKAYTFGNTVRNNF